MLRRFGIPALLLCAPLIFFHRVCLMGETFLLRDLFNWFFPWRAFAADSFAKGDLPIWNPYSYTGTPFLANMQSGLLYPPNLVFWILDFPDAMRVFLIIQFGLAAWFMYLLLRALSCRVSSSLTGAIGYAYGGWMVVHIEFPNKLAAAAWLPLIVLGVLRWRQGRRLSGLVIGGLATACCVTAGYPQTTFNVMLGAGVVWAALLVLGIIARRTVRSALTEAASLPAIAALGIFLAAAQVVPFLEALSRASYASGFRPWKILSLGLHPVHFLDLLLPHLFGLPGYARYWGGSLYQFWLGHFYCGLATLALATVALLDLARRVPPSERWRRRDAALPALALLALAAVFCMGDRAPLAPLCVRFLPGFDHFKWLTTTSILVAFPLCWLGAIGQDVLLDAMERRRSLPRWVRLVLLGGAGAVIGLGLLAFFPAPFLSLVHAVVAPVALADQVPLVADNLAPVRGDAIRAGLLAALLAGAWWGAARGRLRAGLFGAVIPFLLFADLKVAAAPIHFTTSPAIYRETAPRVRSLSERLDRLDRIYVTVETLSMDLRLYGSTRLEDFRWAADTMLFNQNLPYRLFSASDGDPMRSVRWRLYADVIEGKDDDARGQLLAVAGVSVVLKGKPGGTTQEIEVPTRVPRVHVASGAKRLPEDEVLGAMLRRDWSPYHETIVEADFPGEPRAGDGRRIEYRIDRVDYTNNTVTIDVESAKAGYLVLADANAPGWRAFIDTRPATIFTANFLFRGVDLPAGRHTVRFEYRPASVIWGAVASALGLILVGACAILDVRASRRSGSSRRTHAGPGGDPGSPRISQSP
ncbi:MAG TPA: YfhO family protein [Candidatus Polarisedimenticolia bacterium]|jgi:hypothetical protein